MSPSSDLFEAFYQFTYQRPYNRQDTIPRTERGRLNSAVREALEAGITPVDIRDRGDRYARTWPNVTRSPQGLLANWSRFAPPPDRNPSSFLDGSGGVGGHEHRWALLPEGPLCVVCRQTRQEVEVG